MKLGTLYGIGVGPGDPELITVKGAAILKRCRYVFAPKARMAADSMALAIARRYLAADAVIREQTYPMTRDPDKLAAGWRKAASEVARVLKRGEDACFLTLGDPLLYSTYLYLLRGLKGILPGVAIITAPGITSFCAAAALTEFALGEGRQPVTILPVADNLSTVKEVLQRGGAVVLMKIGNRLKAVLRILEEMGLIRQAVFVARAGQKDQRVETDLRKLKAGVPREGYLSVILVHAAK